MQQVQKKSLFIFLFGFPMTDGPRCSFGFDENEEMIEERESREREKRRVVREGWKPRKTEQEGKLVLDCLPLTRSGGRVFICECGRDKYSMCEVSSGKKRGNQCEGDPAGDRPARQRGRPGCPKKRNFTQLYQRARRADGERVDNERDEGAATLHGKSLR